MADTPPPIHIDHVWSGHPVSFALLVERGYQFLAYYDAERRITVAARQPGAGNWTRFQPPGIARGHGRFSNVTEWDSHNYLALALDGDGHLHLSGNMHNDPLVYYRTARPFDVASLERLDHMTGQREGSVTYPVFFKDAAGRLLFRYRDGGSGRGSDLYNVYDAAARRWSALLDTPLLDGQGRRNAYALDPVLGPDGKFHLAWMWRDTPDAATNHTLSYARSADLLRWENSRGEPLVLPVTIAAGEVIDPAGPGEGLINMTFNLGFDARARPVVVYHRYDAAGNSQVFAARPDAAAPGGWLVRPISTWDFRWAFGGEGSLAAEVLLGPPRAAGDRHLLIDYLTTRHGAGRWHVDADTLETIAPLAPPSGVLPEERMQPTRPDMRVQTVEAREGQNRWVLRWETLPRHSDRPRDTIPSATELLLYELPAGDTNNAARIGS